MHSTASFVPVTGLPIEIVPVNVDNSSTSNGNVPCSERITSDTYIHTQAYMHIYTCLCPHHPYMHTCIKTCIKTYIKTYIHAYIHPFIHTYMQTYIHANIHTYTYIHTLYTHIHTYILTYTHTDRQTCIHTYT